MRLLLSLILLTLTLGAVAATAQEEQARLKEVEKEIKTLQSSLSSTANKQSKLEQALKKLDLDISKTSKMLQSLNAETIKSQKALALLEKQQADEQAKLAAQQAELKAQIRATYLTGHNPLLKIMLMQDNPTSFSRLLAYYGYFNQARHDQIESLQASLESIKAREVLINEALMKQKALQAEQYANYQNALKEQALREDVLKSLNQEITQKGNRIAKLQSDATALNNIIKKLQTKQETLSPAPTRNKEISTASMGKLPWPTEGVLAHRFGSQRQGNKVLWNGIFIKAAEGTPVKAVRSGKVIFADWLRGYGMLVILDHGNNTLSLYAYNQNIHKNVGDWALANEPIATVGKSGGMADPGLYFEIRQAGNPIDPLKWLHKQG